MFGNEAMDEITISNGITTEKSFGCAAPAESMEEEIHSGMLLTLPKADIFVDDETPTPTRLIRNCEEVGLFDDLRNVNPFEETFRRAVEQNAQGTPTTTVPPNNTQMKASEDDTLHTPQVFAQLVEPIVDNTYCNSSDDLLPLQKQLGSPGQPFDVPVMGDLVMVTPGSVVESADVSNVPLASKLKHSLSETKMAKYKVIAEKPTTTITTPASAITLIQPQIITLSFPNNITETNASERNRPVSTAIPIQPVKPFILPKPAVSCSNATPVSAAATGLSLYTCTVPTTQHEPSSASLTPTSQLPIKERLKAILNQGSRSASASSNNCDTQPLPKQQSQKQNLPKSQSPENCMERKRAAATRYRNKIRNEHKVLRQNNLELKEENAKLRERVRQLEQQLVREQVKGPRLMSVNGGDLDSLSNIPTQVHIPASTVHLVMNIPKMLVSTGGEPVLQNPITYRLEKK